MKYMKKSKILIIVSIIILITILAIYIISKNNQITFTLNGEHTIYVKYGESFNDPGYSLKNGFGIELHNNIKITNDVNPFVPGTYVITYQFNQTTLWRVVIVKNIGDNDIEIKLNGDDTVYLLKDTSYIENGAKIYNYITNSFLNEELKIQSNIDATKIGTYSVIYTLNYNGSTITKVRNVIVFDINYIIVPNDLTQDKVNIKFDLNNINNFLNIRLPDNSVSADKNIQYLVERNGEYSFVITLTTNQTFTKIIKIDNIMDNYTCKGEITSTGTKLIVNPTTNIKEYNWIINNKNIKGNNIYSENKLIETAQVALLFSDNKKYKVDCNIEDKLVYHFKYDENNTKPFMRCDTYTITDKIVLDNKLKQVVNDAGYGTRAGVVAAARFLVGALDYKVPYLGPKKNDVELGRYKKVGLNIGQSKAWGCPFSGYTQGMDCTNFVIWAFAQNGIDRQPYSTSRSLVRNVINQVRVGDLLYTPCSNTCNNDYGLSHVGIIIGIDDLYIYVAEATTGDINAIIVSKWEKYNMPNSGKFSLVHFSNFDNDGNITNMWM